jgi:hypothetical protein
MSAAKKLALIAAGYAFSVAGGLAAVAVNELRMPADIAQTSRHGRLRRHDPVRAGSGLLQPCADLVPAEVVRR